MPEAAGKSQLDGRSGCFVSLYATQRIRRRFLVTSAADHSFHFVKSSGETRIDMGIYHTLRHLLHGILDLRSVNQVNVALESAAAST